MKHLTYVCLGAAGMGAWIGMMVGLSSSPVVAATIGVVGPLAITFVSWFSMRPDARSTQSGVTLYYAAAVGVFGWFALVSMLSGLWIRTHDLLSPTPQEQVARWQAAGFSAAEARQLTGSGAFAASTRPGEQPKPDLHHASILFSVKNDAAAWQNLYSVVKNGSAKEIREALTHFKPLAWFGEFLEKSQLPEAEQKRLAQRFYDFIDRDLP